MNQKSIQIKIIFYLISKLNDIINKSGDYLANKTIKISPDMINLQNEINIV